MAAASAARRMREVVHKHYPITSPSGGRPRDIPFMKRQIDVRPDGGMKFFTPELYLRFNSPDDNVADRADRDWEGAIKAYEKRLNDLRDRMPLQVRELSELCLHDWEIVAWNEAVEPDLRLAGEASPVWSAFSVLSLRRGNEIISLNYVLRDDLRRHPAPSGWPFSATRICWMYDEVDIVSAKPGDYLHRILFSDGTTACIPFAIVFLHRIVWQPQLNAAI